MHRPAGPVGIVALLDQPQPVPRQMLKEIVEPRKEARRGTSKSRHPRQGVLIDAMEDILVIVLNVLVRALLFVLGFLAHVFGIMGDDILRLFKRWPFNSPPLE